MNGLSRRVALAVRMDRLRQSYGTALALFVLAVLPFLGTFGFDYTFDDRLVIENNPRLASPSELPALLTTQLFEGQRQTANYRPFLLLTFAVQTWIHGPDPGLYRVVNVLLHGLTTVLVAAWLLAIAVPRRSALAAAAVFAVIPIHVEAVTSLVGRAEVLAAALVLLGAILFRRAVSGERLRVGPYLACLAALTLAAFSKESAIVAPGLLGLGEAFQAFERNERIRRRILPWLGTLLPFVLLLAVRAAVLGGVVNTSTTRITEIENPLVTMSAPLRILNAANLLFMYPAKTLVPVHMAADHSAHALPLATSASSPRAWGGAAALTVLLAVSVALFRKGRALPLFGVLLFLGTLFPLSNFPAVVGPPYADRLAYVPSIGILVAALALFVPQRIQDGWAAPLLLSGALVLFASLTVDRNLVWQNDLTLFSDMVAKRPGNAKARFALGSVLDRLGRREEARVETETALRLYPRFPEALTLLGKILWEGGDPRAGNELYRQARLLSPQDEPANWGFAKTLEAAGELEAAGRAWDEAERAVPASYAIAFHRALFLAMAGRLEESDRAWDRAIALAPRGGRDLPAREQAKVRDRLRARPAEGPQAR
ncbi:MAG: tetratricopeptide repeat protein [Acidobacteria bacterium]|nr:tetratricopeptide repeat protein [Acidobacteriota bacterium]